MRYYAIKDKESGKWLDSCCEDNELRYIEKNEIMVKNVFSEERANKQLEYFKIIASYRKDDKLDGIDVANLVVVPVELKEVVDDPQEDVREYFTKAMLDNHIYLPVKESKPKWYEIQPNVMIRLDKVEGIELIKNERTYTKEVVIHFQVGLYCRHHNYYTNDLTEEEATAKYNELKKLLEEV